MNLRQLELLRAVIRCETTSAAGRELGLSQPAVSNAIKHLEAQIGFPLFERINNRLFPTAEARALYRDSEPIFAMHAALETKIQDLKENKTGHLRIVATPPLGYSVIPRALQRLLAKRSKIRISLDIRHFEHVLESVFLSCCYGLAPNWSSPRIWRVVRRRVLSSVSGVHWCRFLDALEDLIPWRVVW